MANNEHLKTLKQGEGVKTLFLMAITLFLALIYFKII